MPAGVRHGIVMLGEVTMRTLYLRDDAAAFMPQTCHVLPVSALMRELIVRATELPLHYDENGAAGHVVALLLAELRGSSVLTVADMDNFIGSGGMIQFVVEDARVRVAIDVGATSRARLKVSSKLLSLARTVTGSDRGANN